MREAIANGVTSAKDLYKTVIDWIMDKWGDFLGRLTGKREAYASIDDSKLIINNALRRIAGTKSLYNTIASLLVLHCVLDSN